MKRVWLVFLVTVWLGAGGAARAKELGTVGQVTLSAENLFGFLHTETSNGGGSQDLVTLFNNPGGAEFMLPRLGADVFVSPGFSVGGSLGYFHLSTSGASANGFVVAPRIGYARMFSPRVGLWPRAGFVLRYGEASGDLPVTLNTYALTLEVPVVVSLAEHANLTIGPSVAVGLGGSVSNDGMSTDYTVTEFGLLAGLLLDL